MNKFEKYCFKSDDDMTEFNDVFSNNKIKEMHMDTYLNEPYMLLSRVVEKNISPLLAGGRFVLRKKDKTVLVNIPTEDIENCIVKQYADSHYQLLFTIHKISYKILAII